jgi:hypothetical protein
MNSAPKNDVMARIYGKMEEQKKPFSRLKSQSEAK